MARPDGGGGAAPQAQGLHEDESWFGRWVDAVRRWWRGPAARTEEDALAAIRVVVRGGPEANTGCGNQVHTTKYTWYNFVLLATLLQFRRFSNAFYLVIVLINTIGYFLPDLFVVSYVPWGTLIILGFVIAVTLVFEGKDDLERFRADMRTNGLPTKRVAAGEGTLEDTTWGDLQPGDVVHVEKGQLVPADILLVSSSATESGQCYIETSGIDGETNLKIRTVPRSLRDLGVTGGNVGGAVVCEEPNAFLHFSGSVTLSEGRGSGEPLSVDFGSLVLRGSELRNTSWVQGVVLYAGQETKLVLSSSETPSKFSRLDSAVNRMIGYLVTIYAVLVVVTTLLLVFWIPNTSLLWYFQYVDTINSFILPSFLAYLLTFSGTFASVVPINMYVCLEIVNFVQSKYINWDLSMYDPKTDTPAQCRTSALVAELGQVTHIFTDKTGTLTNNEMRLVSVSVRDTVHGWQPPQAPEDKAEALAGGESSNPPRVPVRELFADFPRAPATLEDPVGRFVLALALCHTVVIDYNEEGAPQYNAEGPDEEALVSAAAELGARLVGTGRGAYSVEATGGETRNYEVLGVNAFSSARKRMSVVVRDEGSGAVWLLVKGADNVVLDLCAAGAGLSAAEEEHLLRFSLAGLRTLLVAGRQLEQTELSRWQDAQRAAGAEVGAKRKALLAAAAEGIERDVDIFGVTGIEDALQEQVPETIQMIRESGASLWVLTGDKIQTAINIALSARILDGTMSRLLLDSADQEELLAQIRQARSVLAQVAADIGARSVTGATDAAEPPSDGPENDGESASVAERMPLLKSLEAGVATVASATSAGEQQQQQQDPQALLAENIGLVVSGRALKALLAAENGSPSSEAALVALASMCSVVLACRVSPKQKALTVKMVDDALSQGRKSRRPVTLAIGDGANDVAMLQEARVGVGISGHEGTQAVNSSDFSIARFKFLRELLFVHGRLNYLRNSILVRYVTFSWVVLVANVFMFVFYSMISGQSIFPNSYYITLYAWITNSVITAIAWFQTDISRATALRNPGVYAVGRDNHYLNGAAMLKTCGRTLVHSALVIVLAFYTLPNTVSLDELGAVIYTAVVLLMFARQAVLTMTVNLFLFLCYVACAAIFMLGMWVMDVAPGGLPVSLVYAEPSASQAWARAFLVAITAVALEYAVLGIPKLVLPSALRLLREADRLPKQFETTRPWKASPVEDDLPRPQRRSASRLVRQASQRIPAMEPLADSSRSARRLLAHQ